MALTDLIIIPVFLVAFAITVYASFYMLTAIKNSDINTPTTEPILNSGLAAVGQFDWLFPVMTTMFGLGSVALAYFYPSHPIFLIFGVIMFSLTFFLVPTIANVFSEFSSDSQMSAVKPNFTMIDWTMANMPIIMSVFGFFMIVVLYSRQRNVGGSE